MKLSRDAIKSRIIDSVVQAIQESGRNAYTKSQVDCPVVTGELRRSGNFNHIENGILIEYTKEYCSFVTLGRKPGMVHVKSYTRKDGVFVKNHLYYSKGSKANPFIEKALRLFFTDRIGTGTFFSFNFTKALKRNLSGVKVIKI